MRGVVRAGRAAVSPCASRCSCYNYNAQRASNWSSTGAGKLQSVMQPRGSKTSAHRARATAKTTRELLWGLSVCDEGSKTAPTNLLFCKGGFVQIPKADYDWLRDVIPGGRL